MQKFVIALAACSFTMTAVALIYSILLRCLRNIQSSKWRYYTWVFIFSGFVMLFKPCFGEPAVNVTMRYGYVNALSVGRYSISANYSDLYRGLFTVWIIGFLLNISFILIKQHVFFKSVKRLARPVPKSVSESAVKIADKLGVTANFKVVEVSQVSSPMVAGFRKRLLILPARRYTEDELYLILKHEIVHLKHHDLFIKGFMLFCGAVHWFNPFIRLFMRSAEKEGELYCDETVMEGENKALKKLYCQSILNTASAGVKAKRTLVPAVASNFSFTKSGLKHRMKMILSFDKKYRLSLTCVIIAALILCTGTAVAFSEPNFDRDAVMTTTFAVTEKPIAEIITTYASQDTFTEDRPD